MTERLLSSRDLSWGGANLPRRAFWPLVVVLLLAGCRRPRAEPPCDPDAQKGSLVLNEVVSNNEGVFVDETGALEDFIEIYNASDRTMDLSKFEIEHRGGTTRLPDMTLEPGERELLWADDDLADGPGHLNFGISSQGEDLTLRTCTRTIDAVSVPALADNDSFARHPDTVGDFGVCRYATPRKANGEICAPPEPQGLLDDVTFSDFEWPGPHPGVTVPLALSEVTLRPAGFVELENTSEEDVSLEGYSLWLAPLAPGVALPDVGEGEEILLSDASLAPGEFVTFEVTEAHVATIAEDPAFEGVLSLFNGDGEAVDRWDFMRYPEGATLARASSDSGQAVFCEESTPGETNACTMLASRDVGDRVRAIRTKGDFAALAEGGTSLGTSAVKFVVDVVQGRRVHLLRSTDWALHYTFIREVIQGHPPLDRCDPAERAEFNEGWYDFSVVEYFATTGRSFFLGTFVRHGSTGHKTVEFALGDVIRPDDMRDVFFTVTAHTPDGVEYFLRPQDVSQVERAQQIEGQLPILPPNAPFRDLVYQPLTLGEGYGVLTWVPAEELSSTALGVEVIVATDAVPNDIPLVGGLITEAFQTPLAHVNVLSQNRGTPNMALRDASKDSRLADNFGKLVRLTVAGDDFTIEPATVEEAAEFWALHRPDGPLAEPRLDTSVRELVDLKDASLATLPVIGAKAAQFAESMRMWEQLNAALETGQSLPRPEICDDAAFFELPHSAFAVPVVHFLEHFEASGAKARYEEARAKNQFVSDSLFRAAELGEVQELIQSHPVDSELLLDVEAEAWARFGDESVRFRSSSNAEDLPGFNGAGLYSSTSAEVASPDKTIEDAMRLVWASLYNPRAYDERELSRVDHEEVSMGILVHPAFPNEAANGVGISRNLLDPARGDIYYLNSQVGEASVTNPAPGVSTEALEFQWPPRTPLLTYQSASSITDGAKVLSSEEATAVACALFEVHRHFRPLLDPASEDPWFAMEIEYKFLYPDRQLLIKQARPHTFSGFDVAGDCREF